MWGTVFVHCLWVLKGKCVCCLALLFPDWIAAQYCRDSRDEGGFDRDEKGVLFWFLLNVTNIIVLLKKQDFFPTHLEIVFSFSLSPCLSMENNFVDEIMENIV